MKSFTNSAKFGDISSTHNNNDSILLKCIFILYWADILKCNNLSKPNMRIIFELLMTYAVKIE